MARVPEAVFVFLVIAFDLLMVGRRENARRNDADLFIFAENVHGRQRSLRTHRAADDKIRLLFQDQFFKPEKRLADGNPRFEVPRIDDLDCKRPL